jgi:hypothetical protein
MFVISHDFDLIYFMFANSENEFDNFNHDGHEYDGDGDDKHNS